MEQEFEWFRPLALGGAVMVVSWLVVSAVTWLCVTFVLGEAEDEADDEEPPGQVRPTNSLAGESTYVEM